ncbi:MAG: hypothetical protein QW484_02125 [Candidatus Pacearchaeota archaeon]
MGKIGCFSLLTLIAGGILAASYWIGILQDLKYEIILPSRGRLAKRKIESKLNADCFERYWEYGKTYCEGGKVSGNYYFIYFKKNPDFLEPFFGKFNIIDIKFPKANTLDEAFMYVSDMLSNKILGIERRISEEKLSVLEKEIRNSGITPEIETELFKIFNPFLGEEKTRRIIDIATDENLSAEEAIKRFIDEVPTNLSSEEEKFVKDVVKKILEHPKVKENY